MSSWKRYYVYGQGYTYEDDIELVVKARSPREAIEKAEDKLSGQYEHLELDCSEGK